ncbi:hypothetical protein [Streptomyces sp. DH37]|uniref:hypothetical protein n=1 Tax=Streptomyces sp. DH37 TaxID=3040122 RepID=UPI0024416B5A|nr:hypothetical protein [Streptomyces sp. DH37]MDG9705560.1 hypothetical protein [Streptomyces sp. DH37]
MPDITSPVPAEQPRNARQDLLDAIDYPYAYGVLGYETREALVDAFVQQHDSELRAERDQLRATLADVLARFVHRTHPGQSCLHTGHVPVATVERWRATLTPQQ